MTTLESFGSKFEKKIFLTLILAMFTCFQIQPVRGQEEQAREKYEKKYLFDLKIDKQGPVGYFVDGDENYYVLHSHSNLLEVFDKTGNLFKKIVLEILNPGGNYRIRVDENGNILIFPPGAINGKSILLDKDGKLLQTFITFEVPSDVGFSRGIVFSESDGEVLSKLPQNSELERKIFFKDIDSRNDKKKMREKEDPDFFRKPKLAVPKSFGKFNFDACYGIDNHGNIYVRYSTKPVYVVEGATNYYAQDFEICKFNPSYELLAVIPSHFAFVNLDNEKFYELKADYKSGKMKVYRWDKIR